MSKIFLHGDTHGGYHAANLNSRIFKEQRGLTKDDVLIILGDFGYLWDNKDFDATYNTEGKHKIEVLANRRFQTCFLDGNHENFDVLERLIKEKKWGGNVGTYTSFAGNKIYHLKRGEIYLINGKKILTIGGAYSIDKSHRKERISWWPQENINEAEIQNTLDNLDTHDWQVDHLLKNKLKFNEWHFGHFQGTYGQRPYLLTK